MNEIDKIHDLLEKKICDFSYPKTPELLYAPIKYIMGLRAKRIRPLFLLISYNLYKSDLSNVISPALGIEFFHNFTLLHDDIMDNAPLRRGSSTVHKKWDKNIAILSGDAMMIQAYKLISQVDSNYLEKVLDIFSKTANQVCEGQQFDMDFENSNEVTLSEYIRMIQFKTAVLLAASLKIGAVIGDATVKDQNHLYEFGINIGLAFQLKDDLLDVFGNESFGKQTGGDILSNKKTFLYLKALQLADKITKKKLQDYYSTSTNSINKVNSVKTIFSKLNVDKHTVELMKSYYVKGMKHLDAVESKNKATLIYFANKLMDRTS